ncbi:unnamed protein product [Heterobilharzia americana]|nr:unnamed protein product [Heterobilharzia americana]
MYRLDSLTLILSLFVCVVYTESQSVCNLENIKDCCSNEAKMNAKLYIQNESPEADFEKVMGYYNDLCRYRTLNEQATYIKNEYEKLESADLRQLFAVTPRPLRKPQTPPTNPPKKSPPPPPLPKPKP